MSEKTKLPIPWQSQESALVPANIFEPAEIAKYAIQLRSKEKDQIIMAFQSQHYEMASAFIWSKSMAALKKQLSTLGMELIGAMLQRPDISSDSDIGASVTDFEAITLAESLGMISSTESMRLRHSHEVCKHFASLSDDEDQEGVMTPEEAIGCLRSCVQSILGHPSLEVAQDFANFRRKLEEYSFKSSDSEVVCLISSPYFYKKTALSVLLALLRTSDGAQLDHCVNNVNIILPLLWANLKKPEKWQAGQAYAELYSDGNKIAGLGLKKALVKVNGFDYVPENLRSNTFSATAQLVLQAHEGMNNFYNEPAPMQKLASLGTIIPRPAFPICMKATLSVWLGNSFGHSWAAQDSAKKLLKHITKDQWGYYLEECLPSDEFILYKLMRSCPSERWVDLVKEFNISTELIKNKEVKDLVKQATENNKEKIKQIAKKILDKFHGNN